MSGFGSREKLPQRRCCQTEMLSFAGMSFSLSIGFYDDGRPGEVFITPVKSPGSALDVMGRDTALLMSLLIQYGCGARHIAEALTKNADGGPEGLAGLAAAQLLAMRDQGK